MTDLVPTGNALPTGLEDFDPDEGLGGGSDLVFRFVRVQAKDGKFETWLGEEDEDGDRIYVTQKSITGMILGRQKARAAFMPDVLKYEGLICESNDNKVGSPRLGVDGKPAIFPSGFNSAFDADDTLTTLSCDGCRMQDWETYAELPGGKGKRKACGEIHKIPVFVPDDGPDGAVWIIEFKSMQIKTLTQFLRPFATNGIPTYSRLTTIKLNVGKTNDGFKYSEPAFKDESAVDADQLDHLALMWQETKAFMTRSRKKSDDGAIAEAEVVVTTSNANPAIDAGTVTDMFPGATVRSDNEIEL